MSGSDNVVAQWRGRTLALGRQGYRCGACGKVALVRRRLCLGCGSTDTTARGPLPGRGTVAALSEAGAAVEHLDQVTARRAAVLVELDGGGRLACLLAAADSVSLLAASRGQPVRLTVRRTSLGALPEGAPIAYGLKVALDLATRAALKTAQQTDRDGAAAVSRPPSPADDPRKE